jgi:hypothetical protein
MPREFHTDERAVEGMPIRLLVAVTVGVAAFSLLVPMAENVEQAQQTELTAEPAPRQITVESDESSTVRVDVVTTDGVPVEGAKLVVSGRSLLVEDGPIVFTTGDASSVTIDIGTSSAADVPVSFRPTQKRGTVRLGVVPPSESAFADELANPEVTVRRTE